MIDGIIPPKRHVSGGTNTNNTAQISGQYPHSSSIPSDLPEPAFRPPELVANEEGFVNRLSDKPSLVASKKPNRLQALWARLTRKQKVIVVVALVLLLTAACSAGYFLTRKAPEQKSAPAVAVVEPTPPPAPTTAPSPLTGVQVAPDIAKLPVTGVMIENSPDARPQSGLNKAGIVYEAIAEGGITRFMALFQEDQPDYVGPVRSVRPYYLEWVQGYDAGIAHVGGSPDALKIIKSGGIKDLDEFANSGAFQRVSSRYAPHNVYTSLPKLTDLNKSKGFTASNFTGFARKSDKPAATANAKNINVTISSFLYNPAFDYDVASNSYKRSMAGKPHVDERSQQQISPKVVVVMVVPYSIHADGVHSVYQTTGSGKAFIFQDGSVTEGSWEKAGSKSGINLKDSTGGQLAINAGQTWISVVGNAGSVAYKP